jgi:hypothetical protein
LRCSSSSTLVAHSPKAALPGAGAEIEGERDRCRRTDSTDDDRIVPLVN